MMRFLTSLFGKATRPEPGARGPKNARAYAIGDVHGRLDLLNSLLAMIEADAKADPCPKNYLVFLGDLVDRGPDTAGVIERLRTFSPDWASPVFLMGNHEEVMLRALNAERGALDDWLRFGGRECLLSYGINTAGLGGMHEADAARLMRDSIPSDHIAFLESFGDTFRFGDYLLVHAGIRPGVPLDAQSPADLRWIREPFLTDRKPHDFVVVHGHTIVESVEEHANRICIDTGAYRSDVLTALAIRESGRRYLATGSSCPRALAASDALL